MGDPVQGCLQSVMGLPQLFIRDAIDPLPDEGIILVLDPFITEIFVKKEFHLGLDPGRYVDPIGHIINRNFFLILAHFQDLAVKNIIRAKISSLPSSMVRVRTHFPTSGIRL